MAETTNKPALHMTGRRLGAVTADDIAKLYQSLTGRAPTEAELREVEAVLASDKEDRDD